MPSLVQTPQSNCSLETPVSPDQESNPSKFECSQIIERNIKSKLMRQEHQKNVLTIMGEMLHIKQKENHNARAPFDDGAPFLSPLIKKSRTLKVDNLKLPGFTLSLDDDSVEADQEQKLEDEELDTSAMVSTTNVDTPRRVRFGTPIESVEYTISREDMTEEEMRKYWLQDEEFALIRLRDGYLGTRAEEQQRRMEAAAKAQSLGAMPSILNSISSETWICTRGLEFKMKMGFLNIQSKRLQCLENVLVEQERQWDEHWEIDVENEIPFVYDDDALAAVSTEVSDECLLHAQRVADNDRREVQRFLRAEEQA